MILNVLTGVITAMLMMFGAHLHSSDFTSSDRVVAEKAVIQSAEKWFDVTVSGDQSLPQNQQIEAMLTDSPDAPCIETDGDLCAVRIEYNPDDSGIQSLISRIGTSSPPTVKEFEDLGASAVDHSYEENAVR